MKVSTGMFCLLFSFFYEIPSKLGTTIPLNNEPEHKTAVKKLNTQKYGSKYAFGRGSAAGVSSALRATPRADAANLRSSWAQVYQNMSCVQRSSLWTAKSLLKK